MDDTSPNAAAGGPDGHWRSQMSPEFCPRAFELMLQKLKEGLPSFELEKLVKLYRVATVLEEKTYMEATSEEDYVWRIAVNTTNITIRRQGHSLLLQMPNNPTKMQDRHRLPGHSNGPLGLQQPGNRASDAMILQDGSDLQGQFTQDQSTTQQESSSSQLFDQENPRRTHGGIDRISNLPDALIHHIMSFLPTLDSVHTSVLSSRWRRTWTGVPCLILDVDQFKGRKKHFSNFISYVLHLRGAAPLDLLHLRSSGIREPNFWIKYAIKNNVKVLEFSEDMACEPLRLERDIVNFTSHHLKSMLLGNVCLDASVFDPMNSACPALQSLELRESSLEVPEISSGSLLHLGMTMTNCSLFENILISAPCLESLSIKDPRYSVPMVKKLPSLVVAVVTFDKYLHCCEPPDEEEEYGDEANYSLFDGLSNARSMELLAAQREVTLDWEIPECPMFNNLTSLTLGEWCTSDEFSPLLYLLSRSPLLENLTLKLKKEVCLVCSEEEPTEFPKAGAFTADQLKKVTIYFRLGDERVGILLKLLASIGKSIEDIELIPSHPLSIG